MSCVISSMGTAIVASALDADCCEDGNDGAAKPENDMTWERGDGSDAGV
jgi:hypothetical protein